MKDNKPLKKLLDRVGGQQKLADVLTKSGYPISQVAICHWLKRGKVSRAFAIHIEEIFKEPTRYQLRPDYYGNGPKKNSQSLK